MIDVKRESWGSRFSFLFACIGYAVGLGNIWRFPYNVYKSGGGAFLVPYFIMLLLCGIPLLFMELAVGQYTRRGPIGALQKMCPILKGAGVGTVVISFLLSTYYNVILAWTLFYLGASFQDPLPWTGCNNTWNSPNCFDVTANNSPSSAAVSSTQEYFNLKVLEMTEGISEVGNLRLDLFILLCLAWVIVYFCLWRGISLTGRVVYLTASLPCLLLVAFLVRGLTLPGASQGLAFFLQPDWPRVLEPRIWVNAASQVFNSIGIGFGSLIAFSSYNKFKGPLLRDTIIVTLVDALVSLVCGLAVFSVLGNLAHQQGKDVKDVVADGPGLVFVVFPHALAQMPWPHLWSVTFFLMLLGLGIDSQFATVEVIITSIKDTWDVTRYLRQELLVLVVCLAGFLCGIPNVFQGGIYWFYLVDYYSATISLMYIALFETVGIVWCYGARRLARNVADMTGRPPSHFFTLSWAVTAPALILLIWVFTLMDHSAPTFNQGAYHYPAWSLGCGWALTSLSLAALPLAAIQEVAATNREGSLVQKFLDSWKSRILSCPCCEAQLNSKQQAHYSSKDTLMVSEEEEPDEKKEEKNGFLQQDLPHV